MAIRDFFDIDHAVRVAGLDVTSPELVRLLRAKLAVPGTGAVNVSPERLGDLRRQLDTHMRPVLRPPEFDMFDVDREFGIVRPCQRSLQVPAFEGTQHRVIHEATRWPRGSRSCAHLICDTAGG